MANSIDRTSPLPLHYQLKQIVLERIEKGEWQPGALIPGEPELQTLFGLSRTTVRQALSDLVHEGRLKRERGRGTFVATPKVAHDPEHLGLTNYLLQKGIKPGWKILDERYLAPTPHVRTQLALASNAQVYRIRRLRLADDDVIGYHDAYLSETIARQFKREALAEGESLRYLKHLPQMKDSRALRVIEALAASETEVRLLGVLKDAPILLIERLVSAADGTPLEFLQAFYRGDRFKYQITT